MVLETRFIPFFFLFFFFWSSFSLFSQRWAWEFRALPLVYQYSTTEINPQPSELVSPQGCVQKLYSEPISSFKMAPVFYLYAPSFFCICLSLWGPLFIRAWFTLNKDPHKWPHLTWLPLKKLLSNKVAYWSVGELGRWHTHWETDTT